MSIRAYRIIKIERAEQSSFNLWQDSAIIDAINKLEGHEVLHNLGESGGAFEVSVKTLEELLQAINSPITEDYQREAIQADIDFAKAQGDDYVLYNCY